MSYIQEQKLIPSQKTIGYKCDVCNKEEICCNIPKEWHHFNENHSEWGNDSMDSYEYYDVCSLGCYAVQLGKCIEHLKGYERSAEIDGMSIEFAEAIYLRIR